MQAATRKRLRGAAETLQVPELPTSLTQSLRVAEKLPSCWLIAATSAGISSTDGFIVHLGRSITAALQAVAESAEAARAQLRVARSALHASIDARCDDLAVSIDSAEASKAASLERELVAVDAALERWRAESVVVQKDISSLSETAVASQNTALSSRLDDMEAQLEALSTAVVEPPFVGLLADSPLAALLSSIAGFGRVLAPLPIAAADLRLNDVVPSSVRPGRTLRLRLSLGARHAAQSAEELEVSLGRLTTYSHVDVTLECPGMEPQQLQVTLTPDAVNRCVLVSFGIPRFCGGGANLCIRDIAVAGCLSPLPFRQFHLCRGIQPPRLIQIESLRGLISFCVSPEGCIYCPAGVGPEVLVFDADGAPLPSIAALGRSARTSWSAYAQGDVPALLLDDDGNSTNSLVALDLSTRAIRWTSAAGRRSTCVGIAALPSLGVVVIGVGTSLFIHRLSDGVRVGSLAVPKLYWFMAADDASGIVFGSLHSAGSTTIHAWLCDASRTRIKSQGPVTYAKTRFSPRPLAVMPPAPGKRVSHLVVGSAWTPELLVLSLPDLALVHTHMLEGVSVMGLAADPWGAALLVRFSESKSSALHVLAWPLSGMQPLQ